MAAPYIHLRLLFTITFSREMIRDNLVEWQTFGIKTALSVATYASSHLFCLKPSSEMATTSFWLSRYYSIQRFLLLHYLLWFSLMCYLLLLFAILSDEKSSILYFLHLLQSFLGNYTNPHDSETNIVIQIFIFSFFL